MEKKKCLLVLVLVAVLTRGLSAQESFFSAGGGVLIDVERSKMSATNDGSASADPSIHRPGTQIMPIGFGGWAFTDAKYAELSIGLYGGPLSFTITEDYQEDYKYITVSDTFKGSFFAMDFNLLGKYPFVLGKKRSISIFPLLGIGYQLIVAATLEGFNIDTPTDLSTFRILLGIGGDFALSEKLFLRTSLLGLYRFPSKIENDAVDFANAIPGTKIFFLGLGGMLKIALGVKL